ncbi:MAG: hypothetical protein RR235_07340 [Oscillospiraceae bacterium]
MIKLIGTEFHKGIEYNVFLLTGIATGRGKAGYVGVGDGFLYRGQLTVNAGETPGGKALIVQVKVWNKRGEIVRGFSKGDSVLVIGSMDSTEWEGKRWIRMRASYISNESNKFREYEDDEALPEEEKDER